MLVLGWWLEFCFVGCAFRRALQTRFLGRFARGMAGDLILCRPCIVHVPVSGLVFISSFSDTSQEQQHTPGIS